MDESELEGSETQLNFQMKVKPEVESDPIQTLESGILNIVEKKQPLKIIESKG